MKIGFLCFVCLLFRWGVLLRVLQVVGWWWVLYSGDFFCVSSHYLIIPRVSLEKAMVLHPSTLAWKIPWIQSTGLQRVGHDWVMTSLFTFSLAHQRKNKRTKTQHKSHPTLHKPLDQPCDLWSRSVVSDSATPWTVAYQAPQAMEFSRQEYWNGLPFPSPKSILTGIQTLA